MRSERGIAVKPLPARPPFARQAFRAGCLVKTSKRGDATAAVRLSRLATTFARMGSAGRGLPAHAAEILNGEPKFPVATYLATRHHKREVDRRRHEDSLLKAGLPA